MESCAFNSFVCSSTCLTHVLKFIWGYFRCDTESNILYIYCMDLPFQVATLRWAQKKAKKKCDDNESMTKNLLQLTLRERRRVRAREMQRCCCFSCYFNWCWELVKHHFCIWQNVADWKVLCARDFAAKLSNVRVSATIW